MKLLCDYSDLLTKNTKAQDIALCSTLTYMQKQLIIAPMALLDY